MAFFDKLFSRKETKVQTVEDFWNWFSANEKTFHKVVKSNNDIEANFFDKLSPKLAELKDGYFYLTGMCDDNTVELVLTADGDPNNIAFVEELAKSAPSIKGWKFTAFKSPTNIEDTAINMAGFKFTADNLFFYSNDQTDYPDEIDISIIHNDFTEENRQQIVNGTHIFLDNYLGELDFLNNIDNLEFVNKQQAKKELIPIAKLKEYLNWRQKEFIEKYEGIRYNTENDEHALLEAEMENGTKLLAIVNTQILSWDCKASHPWIGIIRFKYDGTTNNGMPDKSDYRSLHEIEESIMLELSDRDGYLNIGRQSSDNIREIYFACKEFRKPSKVFYKIQMEYKNKYEIDYEIYKDKYWRSFERFIKN